SIPIARSSVLSRGSLVSRLSPKIAFTLSKVTSGNGFARLASVSAATVGDTTALQIATLRIRHLNVIPEPPNYVHGGFATGQSPRNRTAQWFSGSWVDNRHIGCSQNI